MGIIYYDIGGLLKAGQQFIPPRPSLDRRDVDLAIVLMRVDYHSFPLSQSNIMHAYYLSLSLYPRSERPTPA